MLLYYISDRHAFGGDETRQCESLVSQVRAAAVAGVDYIQLREKDLSTRSLEALAKEVVATVRAVSSITRVLINQHVEIALASAADGVHLPGGSLPPSEVRALWMPACNRAPTIAVSAHTLDEVRYAEAHGADFVVLAPIFEKPNTNAPVLGLETLSLASRGSKPPDNTESAPQNNFPVLALGGVNLRNAGPCLNAGAAGVAGIRLFQEGNLTETVRLLRMLEPRSRLSTSRNS
jgi:thiamine-phosphate pyrophosphorylase